MGRTASNVTIAASTSLAFAWFLMMTLPVSWHRKSTLIWTFDVGLWQVEVSKALLGHAAHGVGWIIDKGTSKISGEANAAVTQSMSLILEGEQSLRYYRDAFCSANMYIGDNCTPWDHLLIGSWVLTIFTIVCIIMLVTASGFQWYYWTQESRRMGRQWAQGLYITAPIVMLFGIIVYSLLTVSFGRWLSEMAISSSRATFSYTYVSALMLNLFTCIPAMIQCSFGGYHEMEETHEELSRQRKHAMYGGVDDRYGNGGYDQQGNPTLPNPYVQSDPYSQPDPYGQSQAYGQQQYAGAPQQYSTSQPQYGQQPYGQQQYSHVTVTTQYTQQQYPSQYQQQY